MDCRTVWDKWSNCWDSTAGEHSMGGRGKKKNRANLSKYLIICSLNLSPNSARFNKNIYGKTCGDNT